MIRKTPRQTTSATPQEGNFGKLNVSELHFVIIDNIQFIRALLQVTRFVCQNKSSLKY